MSEHFVSPVSGVVKIIHQIDNTYVIGIYIRGPYDSIQDSHTIFAPFSSTVVSIEANDFRVKRNTFTIDPNKKGSLDILFTQSKKSLLLQVEVGSGYVTNEIELYISQGQLVEKGQWIGTIIVRPNNSFAWITMDDKPLVQIGDIVMGGQTLL